MKLTELLAKGTQAITATSTLIGMGMLSEKLDCTEVDSLTDEELTALLSGIPNDWNFSQLIKIFEPNTLSDTFAQQLKYKLEPESEIEPQNLQVNQTVLPSTNLDIFNFRDEIIAEYRSYIESFLKIRDPRVKDFVQQELNKGQLWTPPLVQINPAYQSSATINDLINQKVLHPDCQKYFPDFNFYRHQEQAFNCAKKEESYVLTTGTGSGKRLTYVVPIINDLLEHPEIKGVRAILVYPMNALINSQIEEFKKFLSNVPNSHIRVAQYTGQENLSRKSEIQENPPHILLTNYVMLELMLTRVYEDKLVRSPNLKFLVLDELHTYRGRQGADVAVVIRKLKQHCEKKLLCIGTSATMSTEGSRENRRQTVAGVACKLFGVEVKAENVIDETLKKAITIPYPDNTELKNSLTSGLPPVEERTESTFKQHPLSAWIEMNFGIEKKEGHLVRRSPITLETGAKLLSDETAFPVTACVDILKKMFLWGSKTGGLAFRLGTGIK